MKNLNGALNSSNALSKIMAIAENYPQLVTSDSYRLLLGQIADVENQIYKKRVEYNDAVNVYNTRFLTFPVNLIGGMLGFSKQPYFEWTNKPEWAFSEKSSSGELPISMETEGIQNGR